VRLTCVYTLVFLLLDDASLFSFLLYLSVDFFELLLLLNGLQNYVIAFQFKARRKLNIEDGSLVGVDVDRNVVVFILARLVRRQSQSLDGLLTLDFRVRSLGVLHSCIRLQICCTRLARR